MTLSSYIDPFVPFVKTLGFLRVSEAPRRGLRHPLRDHSKNGGFPRFSHEGDEGVDVAAYPRNAQNQRTTME
jgi:hypothetical protein